MLMEVEAMRQRQADAKRSASLDDKTNEVEQERLHTLEKSLRDREAAFAKDRSDFFAKMQAEMATYKADIRNEFATREILSSIVGGVSARPSPHNVAVFAASFWQAMRIPGIDFAISISRGLHADSSPSAASSSSSSSSSASFN